MNDESGFSSYQQIQTGMPNTTTCCKNTAGLPQPNFGVTTYEGMSSQVGGPSTVNISFLSPSGIQVTVALDESERSSHSPNLIAQTTQLARAAAAALH